MLWAEPLIHKTICCVKKERTKSVICFSFFLKLQNERASSWLPVLLSGVAAFLLAFSSALHTDLSRDEIFERVEGNTWMCHSFQNCDIFSDGMWMCQVLWAKKSDRMTDFGCHDELYIHIRLSTQWYLISDGMWRCQVPWAKTRIGWHRFWSFHDKLHIIPSPLPPPLRRLCNILTIPLIGGKPLYLPPCTLLATINSVKKYKIAPKSGKNNGNFLRSTRITLRGYSHSPLYDIKNQDNLLRQGKQLHTNCIMKVSKVNCMMIKWNTIELFF